MFTRLWPLAALSFQAPASLALRASRPTTGVFYRAVSLMKDR